MTRHGSMIRSAMCRFELIRPALNRPVMIRPPSATCFAAICFIDPPSLFSNRAHESPMPVPATAHRAPADRCPCARTRRASHPPLIDANGNAIHNGSGRRPSHRPHERIRRAFVRPVNGEPCETGPQNKGQSRLLAWRMNAARCMSSKKRLRPSLFQPAIPTDPPINPTTTTPTPTWRARRVPSRRFLPGPGRTRRSPA
jgi:hypothetical protein